MTARSSTRDLVRFGLDTYHLSTLPLSVRSKAVDLLVDQIGLQLACAQYPWSRAVHQYVRRFAAPGRSTIVYHGDETSPEQAAFANAAFGHGQDFDDTTPMVQTHAGAVVVPVAVAVGEEAGASGRDVLHAIAVGVEVMLRVAHSVSPDCLRKGHHTPPAAGPFGAVMAAGLLLGLDEAELVSAMGVAGSYSGGLLEYTESGGSVKRIHCAIPTTGGIRAAYQTRLGLRGPETVLEGTKGFCRVFADAPHVNRLTDGLGERYLLDSLGFKHYNCCLFIHAPIEALLEIVREHGLQPDDIERIDVGTSRQGVTHVGQIPEPVDELGAQFSVHFSLGVSLLREVPRLRTYDACLDDPDVRRVARRVHVHEDEVASAEYPGNWGSVVSVTTRDARTFRHRVRFPKGTPENAMTKEDLRQKFRSNTAPHLPDDWEELYRCLTSIDQMDDVRVVSSRFVAVEHAVLSTR